jgi:GGDEF domain-containing protein
LEDRVAVLTEQSEADRHASFHDPLTGLPNRALFNDRLVQGLAGSSSSRNQDLNAESPATAGFLRF